MLGIIIGVGAVITMIAVGAGAQARVEEQIKSLGSNLMIILPGSTTSSGVRLGAGANQNLTEDDAAAIVREISEVQVAAPSNRRSEQVVAGNTNWSTNIYGVNPDYFEAREWPLVSGRMFEAAELSGSAKVALVGQTVARQLFGDTDPIDQTVRIRKVPFTIIGVLDRKGQSMLGQDQDDVIMVPLETARRRLSGASGAPPGSVRQIAVGVARTEDLQYVQEEIEALLRERHRIGAGEEDDFAVRNIAEIVATRTATTRIMSLLLGAVAGISLVVGGIGIMNIMLVSVTERIREIGLRLAVGAGPSDIQRQFLTEAMLISFGGGLLGILLGILGTLAVSSLPPEIALPVQLNWKVVGLAAGCSVATGLFFGFYPARKAAQLDPIEALRHQG
jgi:putative ABC transport system permease protein